MGVGVGMELAGYRLVETIGEGGMAVVYLAQRIEDGGQLVLKVLREELGHNDEFRRRFLREARYAAELRHPHVVPVLDAGEADGTLYIAMQYVEGRDLYDLLHEGPLEPEVAIAMLSQVAAALDAAHSIGLLHRDVKPGNVLIASTAQAGEFAHCYLTDFGLGKQTGKDSAVLTAPGRFVGTIYYTAPEQVLGKEVDARVDVYSLGCMLFECLCGEPPFPGPTEVDVMQAHIQEAPPKASKRRSGLPKEIDAVIAKAMATEPNDRYASCGELMEAARAAFGITGVPVVAGPPAAGAAAAGALRLEVTAGNAVGTEIEVDDELVIGRQAEGEGKLADDIEISRRHARIARTSGGHFAIEDLGSTNGTLVNGHRIETLQRLVPGDLIELGGTRLVVEAGAPAAASPTEPEVSLPETSAQPEAAAEPEAQPILPPPLRLEIDVAGGEVRLELGEGSDPLRLVNEGGHWRLRG